MNENPTLPINRIISHLWQGVKNTQFQLQTSKTQVPAKNASSSTCTLAPPSSFTLLFPSTIPSPRFSYFRSSPPFVSHPSMHCHDQPTLFIPHRRSRFHPQSLLSSLTLSRCPSDVAAPAGYTGSGGTDRVNRRGGSRGEEGPGRCKPTIPEPG